MQRRAVKLYLVKSEPRTSCESVFFPQLFNVLKHLWCSVSVSRQLWLFLGPQNETFSDKTDKRTGSSDSCTDGDKAANKVAVRHWLKRIQKVNSGGTLKPMCKSETHEAIYQMRRETAWILSMNIDFNKYNKALNSFTTHDVKTQRVIFF